MLPFRAVFVLSLVFSSSTLCLGSSFSSILLSKLFHDVLPKLEEGCSIHINGGLPKHQPLILHVENPPRIVLPNPKGVLEVPKDGTLRLVCSGATNNITITETQETIATCVTGTSFRVDTPSGSDVVDFEKLTCAEYPYTTARYRTDEDPDCVHPNAPTEIGFEIPSDGQFLRIITGCFNSMSLNSIYTHFDMPYSISGYQSGFPRPQFLQGSFYGNLSVNTIFTKVKQRDTVAKILRSEDLANKYIKDSGDHYLARGHYSAKADFTYGSEQRGTFYFINAAPQWQSFNGANWATLEGNLRDFAAESKLNLTVWTGGHGVATLPDVDGVEQRISLHIDENGNGQIDVPALYWKVAHEPKTGLSVGFVGVNNPYLDPVPASMILCESVCDKLTWLEWSASNIDDGYSYCCEVDVLRKTITTIPKFETTGLLH